MHNLGKIDLDNQGKLIPQKKYFNQKLLKSELPIKSVHSKSKTSKTILKMLSPVEAGFPSSAEDGEAEELSIDEWILGDRSATFMLKVKGESMRDAGIFDGDYVVVERGRAPRVGNIVLAIVDNAWTIKYFRKDKKGNIYLEPANSDFPIITPTGQLEVPAVVVSVIRKYA
jgi:repressor LexA